VAAGRPPAVCSGAAAPLPVERSSPAMTEFPIPSTKLRKENAGRMGSSPRSRLGPLLGPREKEGADLRRRTSAESRAPSRASRARFLRGFCGSVNEREEGDLGTFIELRKERYPMIFGIDSARWRCPPQLRIGEEGQGADRWGQSCRERKGRGPAAREEGEVRVRARPAWLLG